MTMHHVDVSPQSAMPASGRPTPSPAVGDERLPVPAVCAWAVDLDRCAIAPDPAAAATSVASAGFVDFDAIESVHVASDS